VTSAILNYVIIDQVVVEAIEGNLENQL